MTNDYEIRLSTLHRSGPPGEARVSLDNRWMLLESSTALGLHLFQFVERDEDAIGQWRTGKQPEALGLWIRLNMSRCPFLKGHKILLQKRMEELISATDSLQQNALGGLFEEADVAPWHEPLSEEKSNEVVAQKESHERRVHLSKGLF